MMEQNLICKKQFTFFLLLHFTQPLDEFYEQHKLFSAFLLHIVFICMYGIFRMRQSNISLLRSCMLCGNEVLPPAHKNEKNYLKLCHNPKRVYNTHRHALKMLLRNNYSCECNTFIAFVLHKQDEQLFQQCFLVLFVMRGKSGRKAQITSQNDLYVHAHIM